MVNIPEQVLREFSEKLKTNPSMSTLLVERLVKGLGEAKLPTADQIESQFSILAEEVIQ